MTTTLEHAFAEASKLTELEQDLLASRIMAELADEDDFDRALANTGSRLDHLGRIGLPSESSFCHLL